MKYIIHIFKHEMRLLFREPRFWIPFLFPPFLLVASQALASFHTNSSAFEGMEAYMTLMLGCLMAPMGAPLAADSFAGERERNSMELLHLLPLKQTQLFWGKYLSILPFPLIFCLIAQITYGLFHHLPLPLLFKALFGGISATLLITTLALKLSFKAKSVRTATQLSLFFIVPLLLFVQFGYELFFSTWLVPFSTLAFSIFISFLTAKHQSQHE